MKFVRCVCLSIYLLLMYIEYVVVPMPALVNKAVILSENP